MSLERLDEALLQVVPFAGFGRAINAFQMLQEFAPHRPASRGRPRGLRRRGEALCRRIYGPDYGRMIARMRGFHPDLAEWILADGYGKVLARPVLTVRERELLIVPMLAALRLHRQLRSHVEGARRVGARPEEITAVLEGCGVAGRGAVQVRDSRRWPPRRSP